MLTPSLLFAVALLPTPKDDFADAWTKVETAIRRSYYARTSRKDEMEKRLADAKTSATTAQDRASFSRAVNQMIEGFGDSHFQLFTPADQGYYAMATFLNRSDPPAMPQIGAWFKGTKDGYTVQMVMEGSSAEKAGLRKGDVMLSINGAPFSPVEGLRAAGKQGNLSFRRGVETRSAVVDITEKTAFGMFLDATRASARIIERNGKRIGYVHLWTMANPQFGEAIAGIVAGNLRNTDGLILDLRDGFGGRPEGIVEPFFTPDVTVEYRMPNGAGMKVPMGYSKPMAVLINDGTRSAKEVVSYVFKKSGRAKLYGTNTAGHVLGTSPQRVNDWAILEIPMVEVITDGQRLESVGVAPDVPTEDGWNAEGRDLVIEAAVDGLSR